MTKPPVARQWTCDNCGSFGPWTEHHAWYGSYADVEGVGRNGRRVEPWRNVTVTCCDACRLALVFAGKLPSVGDDGVKVPLRSGRVSAG